MKQSATEKEDISFHDLLKKFSGSWKILVIGCLLGGIIGLVISTLTRPVYESVAVYTFSIDFARTGLLTDVEEDQALEVAGDIVNSSLVLDGTIQAAGENAIQISSAQRKSVFTGERRFNQWLLKIHWDDPTNAAKLANLWAENVRTALEKAEIAALNADSLQRHILALETCLQQSTSGLPAQPLCQVSNRQELQAELQNSGSDLLKWRGLSNGYFPGLNFTWSQEAQVPTPPIQHARGGLILSGALAGLFVAAMLALFVERK